VNATGGTVPYTYSLTGQPDNATGVFAGLQAGSYTYVVTDDNGCTQTAAVVITEPQAVELTVIPPDATIKLGDTLQLAATSNYDPATTYLWSPANGLSCTDCANPVVTTYNSMEYTVQVTADVNGNPCTAAQPVTVTVLPRYDLFIPNTFTPNSDGNNDVFRIFGNLQALKYLDVQIFNRIGEKVYESNDLNFAWDGTYKGRPLTPAVFVYTLRAVFVDNHTEELYKGTITLIK
ncbi:MAG TPA: gliding motility-associated C-terminal domain-containing protein, partial [Chitinophagales bacterium]|nr:gliding motility-associated C-terminal domain-containing protein [Chitinophagales bacterium]